MAKEIICLDTSVLIDYFRKTNKANAFFEVLYMENYAFAASVVTEYEVLCGLREEQKEFWEGSFWHISILPLDRRIAKQAARMFQELRRQGYSMDIPDLFIGATARAYNLKLATLNEKDFSRIPGLELLSR